MKSKQLLNSLGIYIWSVFGGICYWETNGTCAIVIFILLLPLNGRTSRHIFLHIRVSELFRFLRLLQNGLSVVLHFQGGFMVHSHHILIAAF